MDFWFDDGVVEDFTKTGPFLAEIKCCGIFAIVTEFVGKPGYMNIEQLKTLIKKGHTIASHGTNHKLMRDMDTAETIAVLKDSKQWIMENLRMIPQGFAAPWNILRKDQKELALDYYEVVRPPLIMHFHSRNQADVQRTIKRYVAGNCAQKHSIQRLCFDKSRAYLINKFNFHVDGT